jgi:hypothetical protein
MAACHVINDQEYGSRYINHRQFYIVFRGEMTLNLEETYSMMLNDSSRIMTNNTHRTVSYDNQKSLFIR